MSDTAQQNQRSIAQINRMIRNIVEAETLEYFFWTRGRIERYDDQRSKLGHIYFRLVDGKTHIRCMLRERQKGHIPFELRNGLDIEVYGRVQVYEPWARPQIQVTAARLLNQAIDASPAVDVLKRERLYPPHKKPPAVDILKRERLYPPRRKPPPESIKRIGIITSRSSRAIGDFENAYQSAGERAVLAPVKWQYVMLEGDRAVPSIVDAIQKLDRDPEIDVIAILRGGGRSQHLSVFDNIDIARAIIQAKTYIITGIGHHKDATLADDVADIAVATPTEAAHRLAKISSPAANAAAAPITATDEEAEKVENPAASKGRLRLLNIIILALIALLIALALVIVASNAAV